MKMRISAEALKSGALKLREYIRGVISQRKDLAPANQSDPFRRKLIREKDLLKTIKAQSNIKELIENSEKFLENQ
jgi:hypothetical protein